MKYVYGAEIEKLAWGGELRVKWTLSRFRVVRDSTGSFRMYRRSDSSRIVPESRQSRWKNSDPEDVPGIPIGVSMRRIYHAFVFLPVFVRPSGTAHPTIPSERERLDINTAAGTSFGCFRFIQTSTFKTGRIFHSNHSNSFTRPPGCSVY